MPLAESTNVNPSRPGPKPTLTRDSVVEAAMGLIDAEGLAALNMRRLAAALGVSAMTSYSYFSAKQDLLDAMVEWGMSSLALEPGSELPWDEQLEGAMRSLHRALDEHPGLIELVVGTSEEGNLESFRRALITMLVAAGMEEERARDSLRALTSYVLGYSLLSRMRPSSVAGRPADAFERGLSMVMAQVRAEAA